MIIDYAHTIIKLNLIRAIQLHFMHTRGIFTRRYLSRTLTKNFLIKASCSKRIAITIEPRKNCHVANRRNKQKLRSIHHSLQFIPYNNIKLKDITHQKKKKRKKNPTKPNKGNFFFRIKIS